MTARKLNPVISIKRSNVGLSLSNIFFNAGFKIPDNAIVNAKIMLQFCGAFNMRYATRSNEIHNIAQTSPTLVAPSMIDVVIKLSDEYINS